MSGLYCTDPRCHGECGKQRPPPDGYVPAPRRREVTPLIRDARWCVLVDGVVRDDLVHPDTDGRVSRVTAPRVALATSQRLPFAAVASVALGRRHTLRRFEAGREVLP